MTNKKTDKLQNNDEWQDLIAWGAKPENQRMFEKMEKIFIYGQRLPVDSNLAHNFGGVPSYLIYCEGQANMIRELKALKTHYDHTQTKKVKDK